MGIADATVMLTRTPHVLAALLSGLPEEWLHRDDGPESWSAYAIAAHLVHADATNWMPRIRTILRHGTGRSFEPFDRFAMLGWKHEPVSALLDRFQAARAASMTELGSLAITVDDLERRGAHPQIGEVTLGQVIAAWVAHDLTHLAQVGEVLARRYRDDVGPFRGFMPALERIAEAE